MLLTDLKPPLPNGSDCKCRRVVGHTQDDKPSVPALVIDPIGNSYPDRITPKVMVQHGPFPASPTAARVLEIAHQFLRFRVHADHRPAVLQIAMSLTDQVSKLAVPILVVCPSQPFAIRSQAILTLMQQTPNGGPTNGEPLATQSSAKPANRFMRPLHPRGRITCRNILQQILQSLDDSRIFFFDRFTATTRLAYSVGGILKGLFLVCKTTANRVRAHAGNLS